MKSFLKTGLVLLVTLFAVQTINAQDFPATEAEVKEILVKKWAAKQMVVKEQTVETAAAGITMTLTFNADMTYTLVFMSEEMKGKWSIDVAKKVVTLFDKDNKAETLVKGIKKDELVVEPAEEGEAEGFKLILAPDKQ
jgi:hypothetical protein